MRSGTVRVLAPLVLAVGLVVCVTALWVTFNRVAQGCADAPSVATVWNDTNADGIKSAGEPGIGNVCVYARYTDARMASYEHSDEWYRAQCANHSPKNYSGFTDQSGKWWSPGPMAGGCGNPIDVHRMVEADCQDISISAVVPDGYKATTPTSVVGCEAKFGLVKMP